MSERHDAIHPDEEQLDRLRAGLLDDDPTTKRSLEAHLAQCPRCQARYGVWDRLVGVLDEASPAIDPPPGPDRARVADRRRTMRVGALAATVAALGLAIGLFMNRDAGQPNAPALAEAEPAAEEQAGEAPDLYADIDFYLWMMERQGRQRAHDANSS